MADQDQVWTVKAPNGDDVQITYPVYPPKDVQDRVFKAAGVDRPVVPAHPAEPVQPRQRTYVDNAVDLITPAMATAGGILGAIPGTAFGFGVGGLLTGAAGAGIGAAGGEGIKHFINYERGVRNDYADARLLDTIPKTEGGMAKDIGITGTEYAVGDLAGAYILSNLAKGGVWAAKTVASKLPPGGLAAVSKATSAVLKATGIGHLGTMLEGATDLITMANGGDTTGAIATARAAAATARANAAAATAAQKAAAVQAQEAALTPARRANVDVWVKNGMDRSKAIAREWDAHIKDLGATLNKAAQPTVTPPNGPSPGIGNAQPLPNPPTRQVVVTPSAPVQPQPAGAGPQVAPNPRVPPQVMARAAQIQRETPGKSMYEAVAQASNEIEAAARAAAQPAAQAAPEEDLLGSNTQRLPSQPPPPRVPPPPVRVQPAGAGPEDGGIHVNFTGPNVIGGPAGAPAPPPPVTPPITPESGVSGNNMGEALGMPPAAAPAPAPAPASAAAPPDADLFAEARAAFQKAGVTPRGADLGMAVKMMENDRSAAEAVDVITKMRTAGGAVSTVDPAAAANMASRLGLPSDAEMTGDMAARASAAGRPYKAPAPAGEPSTAPPVGSEMRMTEAEIADAKTAAQGMSTVNLEYKAFNLKDPQERSIYQRELATRTDRGAPASTPTVQRAKDFKESGNYDVLVVGADKVHKFTIFRDTDQFSHPLWHAEGPTLTREVTGLTKADLLKNLDRFVGNQ